jgi:riboflavin synthase
MFTGLVEALATVVEVKPEPPGARITIVVGPLSSEHPEPLVDKIAAVSIRIGDSVALNGCCLTLVGIAGRRLEFQAGEETLRRTNLGQLNSGSAINVERSLQFGDRLGGHFVTGHIDGLGTLDSRTDAGEWSTFWFRAPTNLMQQMASKGSIAIDGVSLTLVDVEEARFSVMLIPHTLTVTTLGRLQPGDTVNLETDVLAKYVERQLNAESRRQKAER